MIGMIKNLFLKRNIFERHFSSIQFMSDLHLERKKKFKPIKPKSENLALCGDIGHPDDPLYKDFLSYVSDKFERVFLIAGNHEYLHRNYKPRNHNEVNQKIQDVVSNMKNVKFLNNESVPFDNKRVLIGSVLWSTGKYNKFHQPCLAFLKEELNKTKKAGKEAIVVTHYLQCH